MEAIMGVIETVKGFISQIPMEEIIATVKGYLENIDLSQVEAIVEQIKGVLPF